MSRISLLTSSMQQIAQANKSVSMEDLGSLRGIGEHLLYLFTFGQVDRGRERLERFIPLMKNMVSLGRGNDALVCLFRDPDSENQDISIRISHNGIHAEVTNTATGAPGASEHLPAPISASYAEMTRLLLEMYRDTTDPSDNLRSCRVAHKDRAYLRGANLEKLSLTGADLPGARLEGAHLERVHLEGATLTGAGLEGAYMEGATLIDTHLEGANLERAHLEKAILTGVILNSDTNLNGAQLMQADLRGTDLTAVTKLEGAFLWEAKISQKNYDWAKARGAVVESAQICKEE